LWNFDRLIKFNCILPQPQLPCNPLARWLHDDRSTIIKTGRRRKNLRDSVRICRSVVVKLRLVEQKPVSRPVTQERPAVGVIEAISTGFDMVIRRPWLMVVPIVLDLFLWIGPRLLASSLYDRLTPNLNQLATGLDPNQLSALQDLRLMIQEFFTKFNLFSWLSVGLFGVPSVNAGIDATAKLVTGAMPQAVQVAGFGTYFLLLIGLSAIGLFIAGFFWAMLSGSLRGEAFNAARWLKQGAAVGIKLMMFGALLALGAVLLSVPIWLVMLMLSAVGIGLASLVPALLLMVIVWALFYCAFTAHGLALYQLPVQKAMRLSAVIGRTCFVPTLSLIGLSLAIYLGLGLIWDSFAVDSWLRVIAIAGHAFIATGLAMASLVYYQNRSAIVFDRAHLPQPLGS
jgi:hypothetical protein